MTIHATPSHTDAASRDFQIFVKPVGSACNLACRYCYYSRSGLKAEPAKGPMAGDVLASYIRQHMAAAPAEVVRFSWHGGEPTLAGLDFFRRAVALQKKYRPDGKQVVNGIQTNGTLIDENWCRFLSRERFTVGLSLDGPQAIHDRHRQDKRGQPSFRQVMRAFDLLQLHGIRTDILCVLTNRSVTQPETLYAFFKRIGAEFLSLLPLVQPRPGKGGAVSRISVEATAFGSFLCAIFEEWKAHDIGRIQVEMFEEAIRTAFGRPPSVCIFRPTCGDVPVVEQNGDFYSCDHYVRPRYRLGNIQKNHLADLLESPAQREFGRAKKTNLPAACRTCEVLDMCNGGCPKDRFVVADNGEPGMNYICAGYKRFFTHCRPFLAAISGLRAASRRQ